MPQGDTGGTEGAGRRFVCDVEADALLNCVAAGDFDKAECVALMLKLRECIKRERVVRFELESGVEPPSSSTATGAAPAAQPRGGTA